MKLRWQRLVRRDERWACPVFGNGVGVVVKRHTRNEMLAQSVAKPLDIFRRAGFSWVRADIPVLNVCVLGTTFKSGGNNLGTTIPTARA
ncbi:MAG: hypothetical protein ACREX9_15475 [Gammaproteobacteria bacterium]